MASIHPSQPARIGPLASIHPGPIAEVGESERQRDVPNDTRRLVRRKPESRVGRASWAALNQLDSQDRHVFSVRRERCRALDSDDHHVFSVRRERPKVVRIGSHHGSAGLGDGNQQRVDNGSTPGETAQRSGATRESFRDALGDVTSLEKPIRVGITPCVTLQTFHENWGRNQRRPKSLVAESHDQCDGLARLLCKSRYGPRIENEHETSPPGDGVVALPGLPGARSRRPALAAGKSACPLVK